MRLNNFHAHFVKVLFLGFVVINFFNLSCKPKEFEEPFIALDDYHVEEGFNLEVVASEPFIEAPVAMDFDNKGRMWVVEMKGYMRTLSGAGDDLPNGTISILEDLDNDGVTDHAKVFLDSLILPRAIAHVYGGLLYAEPPNLWFVDIENDKPKNRVLVDSLYSDGGNVEHQPNGLLMHIDNWIYNAKSNFRYQRKQNKWIKEPTSFRGQWGISKDNFGRLYYNTNSVQLLGDYVLPNTLIENKFYRPKAGLNKKLTPTQRVYPLHATSVNRGYVKGVLDADSMLVNVTSACGPLIYRGDTFPSEFNENAFVCAPEANIVKRNILSFEADKVTGHQAKANQEFIAATEEGFRPVNLNNGPDGNLFVVDMHRGIIQDKAFMTPYLYDALERKKMDTLIGMGRILKVTRNGVTKVSQSIDLDALNTTELVELLKDNNGWLRDRGQQLLIQRDDKKSISKLKELLKTSQKEVTQMHVLHTLNGLNTLTFEDIKALLLNSGNTKTKCHALVLAQEFATKENVSIFKTVLEHLIKENNPEVDLYVLSSLQNWMQLDTSSFFPLVYQLSSKYKEKKLYQEALVSSLGGLELDYLAFLKDKETLVLKPILDNVVLNRKNKKQNYIYTRKTNGTDSRTAGYKIYKNICATCHGIDGEGIESLAPPLLKSDYITENSEKRLALVLLHGLSGPVHVNGKRYELNTTMPGLANNADFTDKDILDIIRYLKSAFAGTTEKITIDELKMLRNLKPKDGTVFTEKELHELTQ
ncbi:DUF7133 domain-containing protein [Seonamhaeicola marinus]|uniref:C-type cytochrome n=1 Tax=Seonamhaeicola marinus TaxID=1912246 RepID=A0A5D0IJZ1_9FLAO|nr:c-type cytochrome [Seonamhaeicola marinus]TYA84095.1 c-type cytochrome [Seonamhaeicola marinus]